MSMSGPGPWAPANETFNRFARMDRHLARKLNALSEHQAYEEKLASAIESGRAYGLRQQALSMHLKKELNVDMRRPPVEKMW